MHSLSGGWSRRHVTCVCKQCMDGTANLGKALCFCCCEPHTPIRTPAIITTAQRTQGPVLVRHKAHSPLCKLAAQCRADADNRPLFARHTASSRGVLCSAFFAQSRAGHPHLNSQPCPALSPRPVALTSASRLPPGTTPSPSFHTPPPPHTRRSVLFLPENQLIESKPTQATQPPTAGPLRPVPLLALQQSLRAGRSQAAAPQSPAVRLSLG